MTLSSRSEKGPPVAVKADAVGGHLEGVFKECDRPGKEHHRPNGPERDDLCGLKLEVQVPGERHEDVRNDEEPDRQKAFAEHGRNTVAE